MVFRTRYRLSSVPLPMVALCVVSLIGLVALLVLPAAKSFLEDQMRSLPLIAMAITALAPLVFIAWYACSFAEVRRGRFRVRTLTGGGTGVDLRSLAVADVHAFYLVLFVLAFGATFGIVGAVIATPVAGLVAAAFDEWYLSRRPQVTGLDARVERMVGATPQPAGDPSSCRSRAAR